MNRTAARDPRTLSDLTRALFGEALSMDELFARVEGVAAGVVTSTPMISDARWIGSIGYELHKDVRDFVQLLREAGVARLIDVRELPMSRRRGYGKTALGEALSGAGIEYVHMRALGNPKSFRDLYKSGLVAQGRELYQRHLLGECRFALDDLADLLSDDKRSALMCVEHDPSTCHRTVILEAMRDELDLDLDVAQLG
jgi:Protein of unknown function, DUF488